MISAQKYPISTYLIEQTIRSMAINHSRCWWFCCAFFCLLSGFASVNRDLNLQSAHFSQPSYYPKIACAYPNNVRPFTFTEKTWI